MSKKDDSDDGSLDLLLDTICNTFGGVLFISLLVVILLNLSSNEVSDEPDNESKHVEMVQMHQRLAQTRAEIERLRKVQQQQQENEQRIVDPGIREMLRKMRESQTKQTDLVDHKNSNAEQMGLNQIKANEIAKELEELDENLAQAQAKVTSVEAQLKREIELRSRESKLPKERVTQKAQMALFLINNRLCSHQKPGPGGAYVLNDAECLQTTDSEGRDVIRPKPSAGTPVPKDGSESSALTRRLGDFNKDDHYLEVFIWEDSFESFLSLQNSMVRLGFNYAINPKKAGEDVPIGSSSGPRTAQ